MTAVCDDINFKISLTGSGLIALDENCIHKNGFISIYGKISLASIVYTSHIGLGNNSSITTPEVT